MSTAPAEDLFSCIEDSPETDEGNLIKSVVPRLNSKGMHIGHLAVLDDGSQVPIRAKPKPRPKKTGPAASFSMPAVVKAVALISAPDSYRCFTNIKLGTDPIKGGGPSAYPRQLWSLLYVLQCAISTQRGMLQWISMNFILSKIISQISALRTEASPEDQIVIDRWLKGRRKVPSGAQLSRFLRSLNERGWDAEKELREQGVQLCIELGRFDPGKPASDMTNGMIGDGSGLRAACKSTDPITIDADGTKTHRRVDQFALFHTEAGNELVYGAKAVAIWSPSPDRHGTICLGADWARSTDPASEAKVALDLTKKAHAILKGNGRLPSNYAYDRAAGAIDQRELNALGMILTTRAKGDRLDPKSDSHFLNPKFIGTYTPRDDCTCTYHLFAKQKQLHLQVINDTGEDDYIPLKHTLRSVVTKGHRYHYSDHDIPCQAQPGHTHKVSIPWNGWKSFNTPGKNRLDPIDEEQYAQVLLYLQPHAPGSDQFKEAYGIRERAEAMHSILDSLLPFKILQRWGEAGKSGFLYGFLMGHNILARLALLGGHKELLHPDS